VGWGDRPAMPEFGQRQRSAARTRLGRSALRSALEALKQFVEFFL
jgi:hypothetical protein